MALRRQSMYVRILSLGMTLIVLAARLQAAETGKIAGRVVDREKGEPLPGANVVVVAYWSGEEERPMQWPLGAATDENGHYVILNVPPGTYTVEASFIGYAKERRQRVQVIIDRTTRLDFQLQPQAIVGRELVVTAYRPTKVEADLTATRQTYQVDEVMSVAGVADITDILDLQADVIDDHFRGGRIGESLYLINGGTIVNPLNNERAFQPMVIGLEQVEVYTSGFSAEYGNVQSGVVNMVTKEGKDAWETRLELSATLPHYKSWGGSLYSPANLKWFNQLNDSEEWLKENPTDPGKPLWDVGYGVTKYLPPRIVWPPNPLNHQDSLRMANLARTWWLLSVREAGLEYKNNWDYRIDLSSGGPLSKNTRLFLAARHNLVNPLVPTPYPDLDWQVMGNLTHRPNPDNRWRVSFTYDRGFENYLDSNFEWWTFDRTLSVPKRLSVSRQLGIDYQHIFSVNTFLDFKLNYFGHRFEQDVELLRQGQLLYDYSNNRNWVDYTGPSFHRVGRVHTSSRGRDLSATYSVNTSLTSQVTRSHLLKAGLQFFYYDLRADWRFNFTQEGSDRILSFHANPYEGALFVQDKMEFQGLIANVGLRLDFYDLNTRYYADIYSPLRNPHYDPSLPYRERGKYYDPELARKEKTRLYLRLQPRIGISFPVSENAVFHLNYGTFTQRPDFNQIYYNQVTRFNEIQILGNPRLRPENTKAYDVGLVHSMPFGFYLDVSAYYKDVTDLVETAYYYDEQQSVYQTYVNRDYADIKGFHISLEKKTGLLRGSLRYNYESAKGKSSNALDAPVTYFERPPEGQERVILPSPEDIYLDYDRTHKAVADIRFLTPARFGPVFFGHRPVGNIALSLTLRYLTGRPYTWDEKGLGLRFNKRTPDEVESRARVEKRFRFGNTGASVYLEVFNLLNKRLYHYYRTFRDEYNVVVWEKDRKNLFNYRGAENSPYVTNQEFFLLRNEPRHYRVGIIFNL
ncbi:MAG: TonB-dependent receptor [candidate division KSB1 bacterium]|nr:TonB-dependent receptor [candidate division KSB1 bacterium]